MNNEYTFKEYHKAPNSTQPLRMIFKSDGPACFLERSRKKSRTGSGSCTRQQTYRKSRSGSGYSASKFTPDVSDNIKEAKSTFAGFSQVKTSTFALSLERCDGYEKCQTPDGSTGCEEEKKECTFNTQTKKSTFSKIESDTTRLKEKLTSSLSPSPFRFEDLSTKDATLEQLVTATAAPAKNMLFSTFYGNEISATTSHQMWKIALKDYILHTLESICLIKEVSNSKYQGYDEPEDKGTRARKTVVFDLDETLTHCVTEDLEKAHFIVTIPLDSGETIKAGINVRPHAAEILKELSAFYDLVLFTASYPNYANVVIDLLDPNRNIFKKRLFRDSCIKTEGGLYIKDLRVLGTDLKSTIIVDNAIVSFAYQLDNGVPIIPYYDDPEDRILLKIKDYLLSLKELKDVRVINQKTFSLTKLCDLDVYRFMKYYATEETEGDISNDSIESPTNETESPRTKALRARRMPFIMIGESSRPKMGRKTRAEVEKRLGKLRASLPKYLESEGKCLVNTINQH